MDTIKTKVEVYLKRAEPLFSGIKIKEGLEPKDKKSAARLLDTSMRYYSDSLHFYKSGEYLNALTALEYAEGWMDAGKEINLLE